MANSQSTSCGCGFGLGGCLALMLSWVTSHSILWAIIHGFCSWLYVIYWILVYGLKK